MKIITTALLAFSLSQVLAQTNPTAYSLAAGSYSFTTWSADAAAGSYPANMAFHFTTDASDAAYDPTANGNADFNCPYNLSSRNRINGIGTDGISFLATSSAQYDDCSGTVVTATETRFVGAAVLALNATDRENINVQWTGGTLAVGDDPTTPRIFAIRLQYRTSTTATWMDLPNPSEYVTDAIGNATVMNATLPATCNDQPLVQLRWVYLQHTDGAGTRPELRLDDITVSSSLSTSVGLDESGLGKLIASPNPVTDFLHLNKKVSGKLVDVNGRTVQQIINTNSIDMTFCYSGVYVLITDNGAALRVVKH